MNKFDAFLSLSDLFLENGFKLYLVGGAVRDYLLFNDFNDLDVVSDAKPEDVKRFFKEKANYAFERYGAITLHYQSYKFDLTTLRKENSYVDSRHPSKIEFINDLSVDVKRRDFTINGMYMDKNKKVYDYVGGQKDLENKIIRMIGDPDQRLKEDPLRILRAIRFQITFNFKIDEELKKAILSNLELLKNLKEAKIVEEIKKMKKDKEELSKVFDDFHIHYLLDMLK